MNQATSYAIPASLTNSLARFKRSPVLAQFRTNSLRVLRIQPEVSVDQAIWQAEAALTRLRAGLPSPEPDLLPWMPEPDEPEIRQAVQRIEEPLQRLPDELLWFDLERDPDGDLLRRALAELDPVLLNLYLNHGEPDGLPPSLNASLNHDGAVAVPPALNSDLANNGQPPPDDAAILEASTEASAAGVPGLLNQANLRLLLAALSLYDSLPDDVAVSGTDGRTADRAGTVDWTWRRGLESCQNPHQLALADGLRVPGYRRTVALWSESLARWMKLVQVPAFLAFVNQSVARLEDEAIGPDDSEAIISSATTRLLDLLVGEVKAQLLAGRLERVGVLLEVAQTSDVDPRRWGMAFRQLRPLVRTEIAELDALFPSDEDPRLDDAKVYLARLRRIVTRWQSFDRAGFLGVGEIGDEAVAKMCDWLARMESHAAVDRLKTLYADAKGLATAESLKQRIAAAVTRLNGLDQWVCHFCRQREMEYQRGVVVTGKTESHRSYGYNSTTVHYTMHANVIPRCARCSDLHQYIWEVAGTFRSALGVVIAGCLGLILWFQPLGANTEIGIYVIPAAIGAILVWALGLPVRWTTALAVTPRGERKYWKAKTAKQYRELESKGAKMTIDYGRNALEVLTRAQQVQG
jgi:hypothetical protein